MGRLDGRVAIITGAKVEEDGLVGIGGAIARAYVAEGAKVLAANRSLPGAQRLADELNATAGAQVAAAMAVDVRQEAECQAMIAAAVDRFGRLDILVNNAGGSEAGDLDLLNTGMDVWDDAFAKNVRGAAAAAKYALPHMLAQGGGSIINTSSTNSLSGDVIRIAYGPAKAALNALTLYIATQYGQRGIRCNAVLPGLTLSAKLQAAPPATLEVYTRHILRPAANTPEDMAGAYVFLASDEGVGMNGALMRVDGGFSAHQPFAADLLATLG